MPVNGSIPSDPGEWGISHVDQALEIPLAAVGGKAGYESNLAYVGGDHAQDLRYYMGPGRTSAGSWESDVKKRVLSSFVGIPEATKCVGRRVTGACGTEADFRLAPKQPGGALQEDGTRAPSDAQATEAAALKAGLGDWWKTKQFWTQQKRAAKLGSIAEGACLRVYINPAALEDGEAVDGEGRVRRVRQVRARPRDEARKVVECVSEWPAACGVYTDPDTLQRIGLWSGKDRDGTKIAEMWFLRDGKTVLRLLRADSEVVEERVFPWGVIPIIPLAIDPILTQPVRQMQSAIDTAATGMVRLSNSHSHTQRDEINSMPAGEWKEYPPAASSSALSKLREDGVRVYFHEEDRSLGNPVTNRIVGIEHTVEISENPASGTVERLGLTTPSVQYHEPSDPENVKKVAETFIQWLRDACWQGHITDGSTAEASGDAYEQKREEFRADIEAVGHAVAAQTEAVLTCVEVIAAWIEGDDAATFLRDWTIDVNVITNTGPVSSDKVRVDNESVAAGTLSLPTALQNRATRDVPAELERIRESDALSILERKQKLAQAFIAQGVDPVEAYKELGWPEGRAKVLGRTDGGITEQ